MHADAYEAYGSRVDRANTNDYATATAWTSVGCVTNITPPSETATNTEVPLCLNGDSRRKQYKPGSIDPGEFTFTGNYEAGDIDALDDVGDVGAWRIVMGDSGKGLALNGHVSGRQVGELNADSFVQITYTIKVSGEIDEVVVADAESSL
jgi:hypothetical protein